MELRDKAKELLARLIRSRFDRLSIHGMLTEGPDLIAIAREAGLQELADEMAADLRHELPPHLLKQALPEAV